MWLTSYAADDPNRINTVAAQSGKSGAEISISYTNCKVIGNGSFGVVWAAKMLGQFRATHNRDAKLTLMQAIKRKTVQRSQNLKSLSRRCYRIRDSRCVHRP